MTFETIETSRDLGKPFQLMLFRSGTTNYRYTTADHVVTVGAADYLPDNPMQSVEIKESVGDSKGKLNFKVMRDHEIAQLFITGTPRTVSLVVQAGHEDDPDDEIITIWTGRVVACEWDEEDKATLSCESIVTLLQRNGLPYKFGATCQHTVYRGGCNLDLFANSSLYTVFSVSGTEVVITDLIGAGADEYDAGLAIKNDTDYRMVTAFDTVTGTLTLMRGFEDLVAGDQLRVAKGCNRTSLRCEALGNFVHYLGFDTVPTRNPFEGLKQTGVTILAPEN